METVSPDPSVMQFTGQCEASGRRRLVMTEGGIEAPGLRQRWRHSSEGADCRQVVRLVQRRHRTQRLQMVQHTVIYELCLGQTRTPMENAMPDGDGLFTARCIRIQSMR